MSLKSVDDFTSYGAAPTSLAVSDILLDRALPFTVLLVGTAPIFEGVTLTILFAFGVIVVPLPCIP